MTTSNRSQTTCPKCGGHPICTCIAQTTIDTLFNFSHAEKGITRFPPNVEQIRIERQSLNTWLIARRNDVELKFPLTKEDCQYLADLLTTQETAP